jgi:hypothetical protein
MQERLVTTSALEVSTATQHQGLVHSPLELMVALLDVAILVTLTCLNGLSLQAVVPQQRLVTLLERLLSGDSGLDGSRQTVGAVQLRHATQMPQGVLQSLAEALQTLREADGAGFPVGVGQHEVVNHVIERTAVDGHAQVGAMGEVAGGQPTGMMHLGEEDLFGRPLLGTPGLAPPLQSP